MLGSRHSFNAIADGDELVSLDGLPAAIEVDRAAGAVSVGAAVRYGELAEALHPEGLALHNLASLPHISVAGAVATGTHGSGDRNGSLAAAVRAVELVTSEGDLVRAERGDDGFDGMVVGLGALGALTRLTLDAAPAYDVAQRVYEGLGWDALLEHLDAIFALGYSVSVFTRWGDEAGRVWVKRRADDPRGDDPESGLFGARRATEERHPILGADPVHATAQRGVPGRWADRLPHFRMGFTPSAGDELQTEYLLPREHAVAAIAAIRGLAADVVPLLQISELRTVAADALWMSPQEGRETLAVHFTWLPDQPAVEGVLARLEAALAPFGARPHWGKLFAAHAGDLAPLYRRREDFLRLAERLDARGAFRNRWLEERVIGQTKKNTSPSTT